MAFVCTASQAHPRNFSQTGNRFAMEVWVGFDNAIDRDYFVMAGLGGAHDGMEYFFCIIQSDDGGNKINRIWRSSGLPVDCTKQNRSDILSVLLAATDDLLRKVAPKVIYRGIEINLPDKALAKHRAVDHVDGFCHWALVGKG